ncbi:uncharacterized protein A4U43_C07F7300 [Asparagus officinalis]|uniref:DUF7731 domain-containing protein n=1 Tax=Asparagus officinalis TaxID=4686 RepID=A0A5P1EF71_ASPOF|nr:uncharacterized protein LOC109848650 [Asparagus officinalis]ONK62710.1 uncharacterized protein A4U43_C07F7300 [Asparagus officinalis]
MRSFALTLVMCFLLANFIISHGKDPRAHPNLSPFQQWESAYDCLQNNSARCSDKYQLTQAGWVNVTLADTEDYCKGGCANDTAYVLQCLDDVMRGDFKFENKETVKDINYTITQGCSSGFTGKALDYTSSGRMIQVSMTSTCALAFLAWLSISYIIM